MSISLIELIAWTHAMRENENEFLQFELRRNLALMPQNKLFLIEILIGEKNHPIQMV